MKEIMKGFYVFGIILLVMSLTNCKTNPTDETDGKIMVNDTSYTRADVEAMIKSLRDMQNDIHNSTAETKAAKQQAIDLEEKNKNLIADLQIAKTNQSSLTKDYEKYKKMYLDIQNEFSQFKQTATDNKNDSTEYYKKKFLLSEQQNKGSRDTSNRPKEIVYIMKSDTLRDSGAIKQVNILTKENEGLTKTNHELVKTIPSLKLSEIKATPTFRERYVSGKQVKSQKILSPNDLLRFYLEFTVTKGREILSPNINVYIVLKLPDGSIWDHGEGNILKLDNESINYSRISVFNCKNLNQSIAEEFKLNEKDRQSGIYTFKFYDDKGDLLSSIKYEPKSTAK